VLTITIENVSDRVPVAVMKLEGELDAASYLDVIERARQLSEQGTKNILLDLANLTYMGSSGLFALHSVAMLLRGQEPPDPEGGWSALHSVEEGESEAVERVKLLDPQPQVDRVLERTGMKRFFETYTDRAAAIGSF
jgi:anti-anti-sigma regulatory factor